MKNGPLLVYTLLSTGYTVQSLADSLLFFLVFVNYCILGQEPVRLMISPRIGKEFINLEAGIMYLNAVARYQGYVLSVKSHKTKDQQTVRVYFECLRANRPERKKKVGSSEINAPELNVQNQVDPIQSRSSSSKKTGCTFEVSINFHSSKERWVVTSDATKNPLKSQHNHPAFQNLYEESRYRRPDTASEHRIALLSSAGVRPSHIRPLLNVEGGSNLLLRDIYNARARHKRNWLNGRTPIEGLLDLVTSLDWAFRTVTSEEGILRSFFFASPEAILLARRFPTVLGIDCTYKTNRFNIPLLHIVGTTNSHKSFTVALCFLESEVQDSYEWALRQLSSIVFDPDHTSVSLPKTFATDAEPALYNAITTVFPQSTHILCIWHINQNIGKNCKKRFKDGDDWEEFLKLWNNFCSSPTAEDYDINLKAVSIIATKHNILDYLEKTWIYRVNKFVLLFTSQTPHFGNSSTSRVEGGHYGLKSFLEGRNNDFLTCFNAFKRHGQHQYTEITILNGIEKGKTLQDVPPFLKDLNGKISHFAIKMIWEQYALISHSQTSNRPCLNTFRTAWGLPCSHDIAHECSVSDYLSPRLVHNQWRLAMEVQPDSLEGLQTVVRRKLDSILELPEHSLRKIYEEVNLIQTGRYALVPILPPVVKRNNRGRPKTASQKDKISESQNGRWKSMHEVQEMKEKKKQKAKRRKVENKKKRKDVLTAAERALDSDSDLEDVPPSVRASSSDHVDELIEKKE